MRACGVSQRAPPPLAPQCCAMPLACCCLPVQGLRGKSAAHGGPAQLDLEKLPVGDPLSESGRTRRAGRQRHVFPAQRAGNTWRLAETKQSEIESRSRSENDVRFWTVRAGSGPGLDPPAPGRFRVAEKGKSDIFAFILEGRQKSYLLRSWLPCTPGAGDATKPVRLREQDEAKAPVPSAASPSPTSRRKYVRAPSRRSAPLRRP